MSAGATALGLVSDLLTGAGVIPDTEIARLVEYIRSRAPHVQTVLLTNVTDSRELSVQIADCGTHLVQLCQPVALEEMAWLRDHVTSVGFIHVVHVTGEDALDEARERAPHFDAFILDSKVDAGSDGRPLLGGTGIPHDWGLSARIVEAVDIPVILAGGLTPDNVAEAIEQVRPAGVDVCTGIRAEDTVSGDRATAFVESARASLENLRST